MSTRDDIIRIIKDPSLTTVTALTQYVEALTAHEECSREVHRLNAELDAAKARTVEWMDRYNAQVEAERQSMTDLRARVGGLPVQVVNMQAVPGQPDDFREAWLVSDALALLEEKP